MRLVYHAIFILMLLAIQPCCSQKKTEKVDNKRKITKQDSIKISKYFDVIDLAPLFSMKRQQYLDSVLIILPWNSQLWQQKAMPLFKQKKYELGMVYIDSAVKYDKSQHWLEYRAFIKCIFQKSYRAAIIDFNLAQKMVGNSVVMDHSYEFYKGLCYLQLNQIDSAEYLIKKCIAEERKARGEEWIHHLHWFYMGVVQYEKENYKNAVESFDQALKLYPQFSDAQYYKALCLADLNDKKASLDMLLAARVNLKNGFTINEDNAIYESYPYQINKFYLDGYIEYLQQEKGN